MATNNADPLVHVRYMANVRRQSAPPRCNPFVIVAQVLALGMIFIGLTMTLIAHWPGATTIGENPLKIAGPVLLCVGFVVFLLGLVAVCFINSKEQRRWNKTIAKIASSHAANDNGNPFNAVPGEKAPINYGPVVEPDSNRQLLPGRNLKDGSGSEPVSRYANVGSTGTATAARPLDLSEGDSSYFEDDSVPQPIRARKKRPGKKPGDNGSSTEDLATTTTTTTKTSHGGNAQQVTTTVTEETTVVTKKWKSKPGDAQMREEHESLMAEAPGTRPKTQGVAQPSPSPGEARRLRVHVKALPGATVSIHQAGPPPPAPKPAFKGHNQSSTSNETDL